MATANITQQLFRLEPHPEEDPGEYVPTMPLPGVLADFKRSGSIPPPSAAPRRAVLCPRLPKPGPKRSQEGKRGSNELLSGRHPVQYMGLLPSLEEVRHRSVGSPIEEAPPPPPREFHEWRAIQAHETLDNLELIESPADPSPPPAMPFAPAEREEAKEFVGALRRRGWTWGVAIGGAALLVAITLALVSGNRSTDPQSVPAAVVKIVEETSTDDPKTPTKTPLTPKRIVVSAVDVQPPPALDLPEQQIDETTVKLKTKRPRRRALRRRPRNVVVDADALLTSGQPRRVRQVNPDALLANAKPAPTRRAYRARARDRSGFLVPAWAR